MRFTKIMRFISIVALGLAVLSFFVVGDLPAGQAWFNWHSPSLPFVQAVFQRYLGPPGKFLWDPHVITALSKPLWLNLLVFSAVLYLVSLMPVLIRRIRGRASPVPHAGFNDVTKED